MFCGFRRRAQGRNFHAAIRRQAVQFRNFYQTGGHVSGQKFYNESTQTYEAILRLWPLHQRAPELQSKIVENYLRDDQTEKPKLPAKVW
jgi:hypothetical protein